jgi:hypothetical protein
MWQSFPVMKNNTSNQVEATLKNVKNGDRFRVRYSSEGTEKKLIARVIPYEKSAQGKRALEKNGVIGKAVYFPAEGYGEGVCRLISNPEKGLYFSFQRNMQDEKSGEFIPAERRTMFVENILEIEKI